ncbi:hypothetical protein [Wukongibacter sp. M2B1]|uniref:exodeoxyribonuclease X C-terminal domain-containing protein n=1 Tax=Wukongibacter sp. M2B1 TaxID=3088895 RepID=UPI003D7BA489
MNSLQTTENNTLSILESVDIDKISTAMQKISRFQAVVQQTLKSGHDYGTIPGTNKPTLFKPGAEKILMLMGITSIYNIIEEVKDYTNGFFAFSVKCELYRGDQKITEGFGHCNTREDKYRWRWVSEKDLPLGTDKENLKCKTRKGKYGEYTQYQIENEDPYTLANTCLKMAKKRAQIDATLTVAALSEVFTQDVEDMKNFIHQEQVDTMTNVDAENIKLSFGKYKGKTLGEIVKGDRKYIEWISQNAKDAVMRKAATELLLENIDNQSNSQQVGQMEFLDPEDDPDTPF